MVATETEQDTSLLFDHCTTVYAAMKETSAPQEDGTYLWSGFLTHLFQELGYGIPRYSRITGQLKDMGCIVQVRRGTSGSPSEWRLLGEPTQSSFDAAKGKQKVESRKPKPMEQMLRDLTARVNELEATVYGED